LNFFKIIFEKQNKHVLIKKFNSTSNEKKYYHPTFVQYKKVTSIYFLFIVWKKKFNKRIENKFKEEKNKIENILKGKNKEKEISCLCIERCSAMRFC